MEVYKAFVTLYSSLLEVKEKRCKAFRQKKNLDLLKTYPTPQDRF